MLDSDSAAEPVMATEPGRNGATAMKDESTHEEMCKKSKISRIDHRAVIPDDEVEGKIAFKLINAMYLSYARLMHNVKVVGVENLPKDEGCLIISTHSTHNVDILTACLAIYAAAGRMVRGLYHRSVIMYFPALRYLGGVPGYRGAAEDLVRAGFLTACIPGGAEEGLTGHENAYTIRWQSGSGSARTGFACVALNVGKCAILPIVGQNAEEMRFNPIFWAVNVSGISALWAKITSSLEGYQSVRRVLFAVVIRVWFCLTLFSVPIPVNYTVHILEPVVVDPAEDTAEDIYRRLHDITQAKYDELQGERGRNYTRALAQRSISLRHVQVAYFLLAMVLVLSLLYLQSGPLVAVAFAMAVFYPFSLAVLVFPLVPLIDLFAYMLGAEAGQGLKPRKPSVKED